MTANDPIAEMGALADLMQRVATAAREAREQTELFRLLPSVTDSTLTLYSGPPTVALTFRSNEDAQAFWFAMSEARRAMAAAQQPGPAPSAN
jgi:hypothetical protein